MLENYFFQLNITIHRAEIKCLKTRLMGTKLRSQLNLINQDKIEQMRFDMFHASKLTKFGLTSTVTSLGFLFRMHSSTILFLTESKTLSCSSTTSGQMQISALQFSIH